MEDMTRRGFLATLASTCTLSVLPTNVVAALRQEVEVPNQPKITAGLYFKYPDETKIYSLGNITSSIITNYNNTMFNGRTYVSMDYDLLANKAHVENSRLLINSQMDRSLAFTPKGYRGQLISILKVGNPFSSSILDETDIVMAYSDTCLTDTSDVMIISGSKGPFQSRIKFSGGYLTYIGYMRNGKLETTFNRINEVVDIKALLS